MGIRAPQILPARTRLQGYFVWDILDFLVNATCSCSIGLQLRTVVDGLSGYSAGTLAGYALAVTRRRRRHPARLVLHRPVPDPGHRPPARAARAAGRRAAAARDGLERDARRRVAGRGARAPAHDRRGRRLPAARPHHLPDLRRHLLHARRPGALAAGPDPPPRHQRRRRARRRGAPRPARRDEGRARAARRAGRRGVDPRRHDRADARRCTSTASGASPPAPARSRTTATRIARSPTSRWCSSCSPRSATRSCGCAATASSPTR